MIRGTPRENIWRNQRNADGQLDTCVQKENESGFDDLLHRLRMGASYRIIGICGRCIAGLIFLFRQGEER